MPPVPKPRPVSMPNYIMDSQTSRPVTFGTYNSFTPRILAEKEVTLEKLTDEKLKLEKIATETRAAKSAEEVEEMDKLTTQMMNTVVEDMAAVVRKLAFKKIAEEAKAAEEKKATAEKKAAELMSAEKKNKAEELITSEQKYLESLIKKGYKIIIFMRGCPGSGKSYMAHQIIERTVGGAPEQFIYSTDDYFIKINQGVYKFEPKLLSTAHSYNKSRVRIAIKKGVAPIIVDNTNLQLWEMEEYLPAAVSFLFYFKYIYIYIYYNVL